MPPTPPPTASAGPMPPISGTAPPVPLTSSTTIVATVGTESPSQPSQPQAVSTLAVAGVLSGAVFAAVLTASIAVWTARRKSREEERARQRDLFASAFQAYAAYKEMPYAIRRRRHDDGAAERIRLSEATREIQSELSYFTAWTAAESSTVGEAYAALVRELRKVAGGAMREAWQATPITEDPAMNIPPAVIDLSSLLPLEIAFTDAVRAHLDALAPWWAR